MNGNFIKGIYMGAETEYTLRDSAAGLWWVDVTTNVEVGSWNFKTEAEAVAFINGYELGTGAEELPVLLEDIED